MTSGSRCLLLQALMGGGIWNSEFGLIFSCELGLGPVSVLSVFSIPYP